jgi:hypothetical protein
MKKKTTTPAIPPAVVDNQVCRKFSPIPNDIAGANRNLILLTSNTITILKNPDKVLLYFRYNA